MAREIMAAERRRRNLEQAIATIENILDDRRESLIKGSARQIEQLMEPWNFCFTPTKGKTSVIMFVGLQGSGITSTCMKYASYHQMKGWHPAIVSADTNTETDIAKIVFEGVEKFKNENCDLIIIDTSAPQERDSNFFEDLHRLFEATEPDLVVNVMDASIGRSALEKVDAFIRSVSVAALIFTKMDRTNRHDLLYCILATRCPVIFIGTGEQMYELEVFDVEEFVRRYLGVSDWRDVRGEFDVVVPLDRSVKFGERLREGKFTLRDMYQLYRLFLKMDPFEQCLDVSEFPDRATIKRQMSVMDSMTAEELESSNPNPMSKTRMMRIARGSGRPLRDVKDTWKHYKHLTGMPGSHTSQVIA